MFRVDMRQILGHVDDFARFSEELSDVAEVTVIAAVTRCEAELAAQYGWPLRSLSRKEATLEDVFVELTRKD
jgi:hypothetical protein